MIPPTAERRIRECNLCVFWSFSDFGCWIGMDKKHRPHVGADRLVIGVGGVVEHVFPCDWHYTPDEAAEKLGPHT